MLDLTTASLDLLSVGLWQESKSGYWLWGIIKDYIKSKQGCDIAEKLADDTELIQSHCRSIVQLRHRRDPSYALIILLTVPGNILSFLSVLTHDMFPNRVQWAFCCMCSKPIALFATTRESYNHIPVNDNILYFYDEGLNLRLSKSWAIIQSWSATFHKCQLD